VLRQHQALSPAPKLVPFDRVSNLFYTFITRFSTTVLVRSLKTIWHLLQPQRLPHAHKQVEFDQEMESTGEYQTRRLI